MSRHADVDGRTVGRQARAQVASADRLRAGIEGLGGVGQAKIAMTYEDGWTGGRVQAIPPQIGVTSCHL